MKKKLIIIMVVLGLGFLGFFLLQLGGQMQSRAIQEAKLYHSDEICADVRTPAVHTATGAHYTFPDSCLAPGWEPVQTSVKQTKAEAISEAKQYQVPEGVVCMTVMTPAVHIATGAEYTFGSSCLAPGWEAVTSAPSQQ